MPPPRKNHKKSGIFAFLGGVDTAATPVRLTVSRSGGEAEGELVASATAAAGEQVLQHKALGF